MGTREILDRGQRRIHQARINLPEHSEVVEDGRGIAAFELRRLRRAHPARQSR